MPASGIDLFYMQEARNNFDAIRPAPICTDANQFVGQCQNIHISTNCYYGYHDPKTVKNVELASATDCEMTDLQAAHGIGTATASPQSNARKRTADDCNYPDIKRLREEVQRENTNEPETTVSMPQVTSDQHLLESLYWNTHGGNVYHLIQCL